MIAWQRSARDRADFRPKSALRDAGAHARAEKGPKSALGDAAKQTIAVRKRCEATEPDNYRRRVLAARTIGPVRRSGGDALQLFPDGADVGAVFAE